MIKTFNTHKETKIQKLAAKLLPQIRTSAEALKHVDNEDLKQKYHALSSKYPNASQLNDLLIEHYALVTEAIRRIMKIQAFDSQILAGIFLQDGKVVEMKTGEGKTLSAVFAACFYAKSGNGVHILTFNDYLAKRDSAWMKPVYDFFGHSVGYISEKHNRTERKKAYACNITYVTAREAGFDFLRDNIVFFKEDRMHRPFNVALIDEIDSILIDEARVPLVISKNSINEDKNWAEISSLVSKLQAGEDFETNPESSQIYLTEQGQALVQEALDIESLYQEKNIGLLNSINLSLHAHFLFRRDIDYIVRDGKIEQVDQFTGRVADKRRWPDGLQAAVEAKEQLEIQAKTQFLGSIALKNFLEQYRLLSGMTGTAITSEKEFLEFYDLSVVVLPTEKPVIREDLPDRVFLNKEAKNEAIFKETLKVNRIDQPILVGTESVEESEHIGRMLEEHGLQVNVLNAKSDSEEARIISQAGRFGSITISTALAGRGTDIKLGGGEESEYQQVKSLGGLYVLGTYKHESKRIDNQLKGRAGRQGDPGKSRFFISLEDELLVNSGIPDLLPKNSKDHLQDPLRHPFLLKSVDRVQKKIEEQHYKIRKTLFTYAGVIENQRKIFQENREDILINGYKPMEGSQAHKRQAALTSEFSTKEIADFWRIIALLSMDKQWSMHLHNANEVKESIHLSSLAGLSPSSEFNKITAEAFIQMMDQLDEYIEMEFQKKVLSKKGREILMKHLSNPSSTYTELMSDQPFGEWFELLYISNSKTDLTLLRGFFWPIFSIFRKKSNAEG